MNVRLVVLGCLAAAAVSASGVWAQEWKPGVWVHSIGIGYAHRLSQGTGGGVAAEANFMCPISPWAALGIMTGYYRGGRVGAQNLGVIPFTAQATLRLPGVGVIRPYLNAGAGPYLTILTGVPAAYHQADKIEIDGMMGWNAGGGLEMVMGRVGVGVAGRFHRVNRANGGISGSGDVSSYMLVAHLR